MESVRLGEVLGVGGHGGSRGRVALGASEGGWDRDSAGLGQEDRGRGSALVPVLAFKCSWG